MHRLNIKKPTVIHLVTFGTYVEVSFAGIILENVYKIPQSLVNNRKIWIVDDQDKLQSLPVEVIREEGSDFFISSGITAQERLAKNLPEYPQKGMPVKVLETPSTLMSDTPSS